MSDFNTTIESAVAGTVAKPEKAKPQQPNIFMWLARGGTKVAPWWSRKRDQDLRRFWMESDYLSGAIYNAQVKLSSLPYRIVARDESNYDHIREAEELTEVLNYAVEFGAGWQSFSEKAVQNFLTQDNGVFIEVIGDGPKDGPIAGPAVSLRVLDSGRCIRTGDPIYPVYYEHTDGRLYKMHWSRIIYGAQMASTDARMHGVGYCAVSRAISIAQTLTDWAHYKQEMMGSRPRRNMLVTRGGLDPEDIATAFQLADNLMDAEGYKYYSKTVVVGDRTLLDAGVEVVDLTQAPEGYDEEKATILGMAAIALAIGLDARELFPLIGSGSRADSLIQHIKQRGRLPGQWISFMEQQLNLKVLPRHLRLVYDFQDDVEDRQVAEIRQIRATTREQNLRNRSITVRIAREQMLDAGEINRAQLERLEIEDGRLEDGSPALSLFMTGSPYVDLGIPRPLDVINNDPNIVLEAIADKLIELIEILATTTDHHQKWEVRKAMVAMKHLARIYGIEPNETPARFMPGSGGQEPVKRAVDKALYQKVLMLAGDDDPVRDFGFTNITGSSPIPGTGQDSQRKPGPRQADGSASEQETPAERQDETTPNPESTRPGGVEGSKSDRREMRIRV